MVGDDDDNAESLPTSLTLGWVCMGLTGRTLADILYIILAVAVVCGG